ncbi:MAG: hypothetical protein K2X57_05110 [Xanthobacteraceae bacterium]|nr:hypothetical protein [Xanthobacteraceae bacterium]
MRKFILIAGFVLASAVAQAEPRSLSLSGSDVLATPAPVTKAVDPSKTAEAPQAETIKSDAPKYIERPAVVEPKVETPKAEAPKAATPKVEQTTTAEPAKPVKTAKSEKPRRKRYWNEARIIGELHRHGIYW